MVSPTFSRPFSASSWTRGARQNAARGADLRYDLELSLEEAFNGVEKTVTIEAMASCELCDGRGCTSLDRCASACKTCGGMGKVRAQQGFFVVERGCPTCRGSGEVINDPCANCHGEGRALEPPDAVGQGPRRASTKARASASPAKARPASAAPARGDLYLFVHMKRHAIYTREGTTLIAECPVSFTTAALGGAMSLPGCRR